MIIAELASNLFLIYALIVRYENLLIIQFHFEFISVDL